MTPERKLKLLSVLNKRQNDITIVLENVFDPHNISAVMRSCDAVGIQDLYVINTQAAPNKRWGYRSSSGSYKWITTHQFTNIEECVFALRKNYSKVLTTHLNSEFVNLFDVDLTQSVALVFGNEQEGVSEAMCKLADGNFSIPQVGMIKSLNISVACAVTLFEAFRQKSRAGHYDRQQLKEEEIKSLLNEWGMNEGS